MVTKVTFSDKVAAGLLATALSFSAYNDKNCKHQRGYKNFVSLTVPYKSHLNPKMDVALFMRL